MYPYAKLQNMTMVMTMGPLNEDMVRRPRYWLRLFSVLCSTIQCEEIPPVILQVTILVVLHYSMLHFQARVCVIKFNVDM